MQDPTPETPLTADDLGAIAEKGKAEIRAGNDQRNADLAAANAAFLAKQAAERPWWKQPRRILGILTMLFGVGMSIAAGAGADPEALDTARAVGDAAVGAAEQLVAADEAGDWQQGLGGAAAIAVGAVATFGKRKRKP